MFHTMQPLTPDSDFFDEVTGLSDDEPLPLPERFARIKRKLIAGHEAAVADSFRRLLGELRAEASRVAAAGSDAVPTIDFLDIDDPARAAAFARDLRRRGVAVIRRVVPPGVAAAWGEETREYIAQSPLRPPPGYPAADPQMFDLYWSPGQVRARADSRMLAAQRFVMRAAWRSGGGGGGNGDSEALVSTNYPVSYADRFRIRRPGDTSMGVGPHMDGGSVERWESDGYGRGGGSGGSVGTYGRIFEGRWEDHDPWDADARLAATSDLYNGAGACSMFRMFQGWLTLSTAAPGEGSLRVCPMLRLATAYVLLRPFFSPVRPASSFPSRSRPKRKPKLNPNYGTDTDDFGSDSDDSDDPEYYESDTGFLRADNWALQARPDSVVQGAVPGRAQELSDAAHPHLRLRRTLVPVPRVEPGDYVVWHPDAVHAADPAHAGPSDATALYVPACPLTTTNALYLARQRRAFLLGQPAPDFGGGGGGGGGVGGAGGVGVGIGGGVESIHLGRPGVQDINDAGGEEGLRAMGLLAFDERGASSRVEREVVALANGILFPDRFDICYKRGGGQPK